jgi:hypothetical protein
MTNSLAHRPGRAAMLLMEGSPVVTFGIDPAHASPMHKARLVDCGASLRLLHRSGVEVGPIYPVPRAWLELRGNTLSFRDRLLVRYWPGPADDYEMAVLRIAPGKDAPEFVNALMPNGFTVLLCFVRRRFDARTITPIEVPNVSIQ